MHILTQSGEAENSIICVCDSERNNFSLLFLIPSRAVLFVFFCFVLHTLAEVDTTRPRVDESHRR